MGRASGRRMRGGKPRAAEDYDPKRRYSTTYLSEVCSGIAESLPARDRAWVLRLIKRANNLQGHMLHERVLYAGNTYYVLGHMDDMPGQVAFAYGKSFRDALKYAKTLFDGNGSGNLRKVEIIREDRLAWYERFSPKDPEMAKEDGDGQR